MNGEVLIFIVILAALLAYLRVWLILTFPDKFVNKDRPSYVFRKSAEEALAKMNENNNSTEV